MIPPPPDNKTGVAFALILRRTAAIVFLLLLAGYLIFNRSFALLGFPPFYVGEMALGLALVAAFFDFEAVFIEPLKRSRAMQLIGLFMFYGIARVAIDASSRGLDAARDGVLCLYAVAVFLGPWMLSSFKTAPNSDAVQTLSRCLAPCSILAFAYAYSVANGWIPAFSNVKVDFLAISTAVAMCVFFGHLVIFCDQRRQKAERHIVTFVGAFLYFFSASLLVNTLPTRTLWPAPIIPFAIFILGERKRSLVFVAALLLSLLVATATVSQIPSMREKIEALGDPNEQHFATRQGQIAAHSVKWRMVFWSRCIDETTRRAPVFGLGFGTNLTDLLRGTPDWPMFEDSQNAAKYGSPNRNPHSAHVTVFTRLGGAGLIVWLAILDTVFVRGLRNCREKRERYRFGPPERYAAEYASFIAETTLLSVWSIYLLAMSFGVVLENPFGGIWFWTLTGMIANRRDASR